MRSKPFSPLLLIVLLTLLVACNSDEVPVPPTAVLLATPTPVPVPATPTLAPASINITRKDYQATLAKWQSQGIEEYEVEISEIPHASNTASSAIYYVRGTNFVWLPTPWPTSGAIATPENLPSTRYQNPIDSLFAQIDQALRIVESKDQAPYVFKVEFDPTLGYPRYYSEYCLDAYVFRYCPTDSFTSKTVVRLEVLKRR